MSKPRVLKDIAKKTPFVKDILLQRDELLQHNDLLSNQLTKLTETTSDVRRLLGHKFLKGSGIEIGALHMPLPLPEGAKARYVDYLPVRQLRKHYPELRKLDLVNVAIVDNGERLTKVKDNSVDFIIANHFLEHCRDPIGTIKVFYKKLRSNGVLFMAIPNKTYTFDMYRPITTYGHLLKEHSEYPSEAMHLEHCREVAQFTEGITESSLINKRAEELKASNYSIHTHVWTQKELTEMFHNITKDFSLNLAIEAMVNNLHEIVFIIKKRSAKDEAAKISLLCQLVAVSNLYS